MSFVRTVILGADTFSQLLSREQPSRFNHGPFAMNPLRFNRIKPGTLLGQKQRQDPNTFVLTFDVLVMCSDPGAHDLTVVAGSIVPDQQPCRFALCLPLLTAPVQELCGDVTHPTPGDEAQRHLIADGFITWTLLPQHPITGQRFGIRISFLPGVRIGQCEVFSGCLRW